MYEELTVEEIKNAILSKITADIDIREGSFFNDMISPVAYEIWKTYQTLDSIIPIAFVNETSGSYIDKKCAEYGITPRKPGTKAIAVMMLTGTNGTVIPKDKIFLTIDNLEFITDSSVTIVNGVASVTATAAAIGENYNVEAGKIVRQYVNLNGLTSVTNLAATGGSEPETDAALYARLRDYLQKPSTSGNANQYRQWALEVPGNGDAKIFPLWSGPGTVKVVVVNNDKLPVTNALIRQTSDYIEERRPIGATVTVVSGTAKNINIMATLVVAPGYNLQTVINSFSEAITEYFKSIAFSTTYISYAKIGTILLSTNGVIDYSGLRINNGSANIVLGNEEILVLGSINMGV